KKHELAVRMHLGASRMRILRHLISEVLVLAATCTLLSLAIASVASPLVGYLLSAPLPGHWIFTSFPQTFFSLELATYENSTLSWRVLTAAAFFAFAAMFLSCPVLMTFVRKSELSESIKTQHGLGPTRSLLRTALLATQIALAVQLIGVGGLFARSL